MPERAAYLSGDELFRGDGHPVVLFGPTRTADPHPLDGAQPVGVLALHPLPEETGRPPVPVALRRDARLRAVRHHRAGAGRRAVGDVAEEHLLAVAAVLWGLRRRQAALLLAVSAGDAEAEAAQELDRDVDGPPQLEPAWLIGRASCRERV